MFRNPYSQHISDPFRRSIALHYIKLELRKFFPHLQDEESWGRIDADIALWYQGNPTLIPVRDFWNGFHAISMGFKLKNILPWLTSLHTQWSEKTVRLDSLLFGSTFEELERAGRRKAARAVREWYFIEENRNILEQTKKHLVTESTATLSDIDSIIIIRKNKKLTIVDGNRRVLRALLYNEDKIKAYVGEPEHDLEIYEQWIPTSLLMDLTHYHRYFTEKARESTDSIAHTIAELIRDSSSGQYEWVHRCLKSTQDSDFVLWTTVVNLLKKYGVTLDVIP